MTNISMYDQPAQAQFINTYVPLPFNEIAQAGLARQGRYDTNLSAYEQAIADVESMKAIPTSEDERRLRDAAIGMRETADTYAAADYSNPEVVREIAKKTRGIISRRDLADIQSSHASWQQNEELKRKLRAAGQYQPWLDEPYKGYDTRSRGVYSFQTPGAVNFRQAAEQYFNNIKDQDLGIREDKYGAYMQSGITQGTINKVIDEQYRSFLGTEAGRQAVQEYRYRTGDTQSNPEQVVKQMLADVGKEFIRTDRQYIPGTTGSSGKQPPTFIPERSNTKSLINPYVSPNDPLKGTVLENAKFDEAGVPISMYSGRDEYERLVKEQIKQPGYFINTKVDRIPREHNKQVDIPKQMKLLDDIRNLTFDDRGNGILLNAPQEEVLNIFTNARSNMSQVDFDKSLIEDVNMQENVGDRVMRDIGAMGVYTTQSEKEIRPSSYDELYDKLDSKQNPVKREKGDKFVSNGIVPSRGTAEMSLIDEQGGSKATFEVTLPQPWRNMTDPLRVATDKHLEATPGTKFFSVGEQDYAVHTVLRQKYDKDTGSPYYTFESNVGPVDNRHVDKDGSLNYSENVELVPGIKGPVPLSQYDDHITSIFDNLYK